MKSKHLLVLLGALVALTLTFAPATRGEDPPPAPAAPAAESPAPPPAAQPTKPEVATVPTAAETPAPATVAPAADKPAPPAEAQPAQPEVAAAPTTAESPAPAPEAAKPSEASPAPETELRRLDTEVGTTASETSKKIHETVKKAVERHMRTRAGGGDGNERVAIGGDASVGKDEEVSQAVAIFGETTVDGRARDQAVSVFGKTTVNGSVGDQAVSVFGDNIINGSVGGQAVAVGGNMVVNGHVGGEVVVVGGDVDFGPGADVNGEVVLVGGTLKKDPAAVLHGHVQRVHIPPIGWLFAWMKSALFKGRLLSFASGAGWAWLVAGVALGFYVLLALLFPRGIERCAVTLEEHPGYSVLTAFLTMLAMPLVFLLLAITGIGLVVIPFLGIGLFGCRVFGRATMLAWFGRRLTGIFGEGPWAHVAVSVLIGGVLVMMLYLVPILAILVAMLIGFLGLGTVIYTLIRSMRRSAGQQKAKPAPTSAVAPSAAGTPLPVPAVALAAVSSGDVAGAAAVPPFVPVAPGQPVVSAATLPRAGFWIRLVALVIDVVLCALVLKLFPWGHFGMRFFLLVLATYGAVMWVLRGTTIGGSIFHLKVVRLDDRPVDWTVAIVRALSCFLSLVVVGLGFIWVAFDDEKQSWHDKIAGTVVVQVPKSVALI
jgi:uncharacterized RDD family membrane protein YckC